MSHSSPASFLVWAVLSVLFCIFLLFHLWSFDRFKCLKWNNGLQTGAFKRIMTYSYITSVPFIATYAVCFAFIKYSEGFILLPGYGVLPKPYQLWSVAHQNAIIPLYMFFSIAWSLEMVTHLEELCFWLFLVNAGVGQQDWFKSMYFKTWVVGAIVALTYLPLVTILTRSDPLMCEAYTFLAGSLGSFSITIWFLPILWTFPTFLANLKAEGVDRTTVVRLTKFHELNTIRVFFRFCFTIPLIILGIDGAQPHTHTINENMAYVDLLVTMAGFGCVISSAITLVIFFPRNIEGEIRAKEDRMEARQWKIGTGQTFGFEGVSYERDHEMTMQQSFPHTVSPRPDSTLDISAMPPPSDIKWRVESPDMDSSAPPGLEYHRAAPPMRPNRRTDNGDVELGIHDGSVVPSPFGLTEQNLNAHNVQSSKVNYMIHNYTSPLDIMNRRQNLDNPFDNPVEGRARR